MANLHLITGYAGTPHVTAADHGSFNAAIIGSGQFVLNRGSKLAASVITNNSIRIADGDIMMQGRHIRLDEGATVDLTIENGASGYYRNDLIVARYTKNSNTGVEECNLVVIKGTAVSGTASDPAYTSGDIINDHVTQNDMPLYRVPISGLNVQDLVCLFDTLDITLQSLDADKQDETNSLTAESSIADADAFPFYDASATSNKKVTWSVIKSTLGKVFAALSHKHAASDITSGALPIARGGHAGSTAAEGLANLGGVSITKLWENASSGSDFAAQTISLDLSGYEKFILQTVNGNMYRDGLVIVNKEYFRMYSSDAYFTQRYFEFNDTGLVVYNGNYYSSGWKTGNWALKPLVIYGIKGVQE